MEIKAALSLIVDPGQLTVSASQPLGAAFRKLLEAKSQHPGLLEVPRLTSWSGQQGLPPGRSECMCICVCFSLLMRRTQAVSDRGWARGYGDFFWQCTHLYLGRFTLDVSHRLVLKQPILGNPYGSGKSTGGLA